MSLKSRLKQIIRIAYVIQLIFFTIRFFWGWKVNLNFSELMGWLTVETALGVPIMLEWLFGGDYAKKIYESNKERDEREKLERQKAEKLKFSDKLAEELERRTHGSIKFTSDSFRGNLHIQLSNPNLTQTTSEYSDDLNAYLKSEHKKLWDIVNKIEPDIIQHNLNLQAFLDSLHLKVKRVVEETILSIKVWDEFSSLPAPPKYFTKYLLSIFGWYIQFCYTKRATFNFSIVPITYQWGLRYVLELDSYRLVVSDNKAEIEEIEKKLLHAFSDAIDSEEFTKLKEDFRAIEEKLNSFEKEAPKIINDLKRGRLGNYKPTME
jgi:hypothetical protein